MPALFESAHQSPVSRRMSIAPRRSDRKTQDHNIERFSIHRPCSNDSSSAPSVRSCADASCPVAEARLASANACSAANCAGAVAGAG